MPNLGEGEQGERGSHNVELAACREPWAKQIDDAVRAGVTDNLHAAFALLVASRAPPWGAM